MDMVQACNPSPQEVEAVESAVQGQHWLNIEFEASLGYMKLSLKELKKKNSKLKIAYTDTENKEIPLTT